MNEVSAFTQTGMNKKSQFDGVQDVTPSEAGSRIGSRHASTRLQNQAHFAAAAKQDDLYLVPSRWHKSGFKYCEVDPRDSRFFTSPNRKNGAGFSPNRPCGAPNQMTMDNMQEA